MGTISYMPPEMLKELAVNEKVDIYSFAVVLWSVLLFFFFFFFFSFFFFFFNNCQLSLQGAGDKAEPF